MKINYNYKQSDVKMKDILLIAPNDSIQVYYWRPNL